MPESSKKREQLGELSVSFSDPPLSPSTFISTSGFTFHFSFFLISHPVFSISPVAWKVRSYEILDELINWIQNWLGAKKSEIESGGLFCRGEKRPVISGVQKIKQYSTGTSPTAHND